MAENSSDAVPGDDSRKLGFLVPCFFLLALGSYLASPISDADFYFHLTVGRWIRAHHQLPEVNVWTSVDHLLPWHTGSWLFQYLLAMVEDFFGWNGLLSLKLFLSLSFVFALGILFSSLSQEWFFACVITVLVSCGALEGVRYGPELLAWPCFLSLLILRICSEEKRFWQRVLFLIFAVIFANTSPTYPFAMLVLLWCRASSGKRLHYIDVLILLLALFATPGFGSHLFFAMHDSFKMVMNRLLLQIAPATVFDFSFAFLLLLWLMLILLSWRKDLESHVKQLILAAGVLSAFGLGAKEFLPWSLILLGAALCAVWQNLSVERTVESKKQNFEEAIEHLHGKLVKLPAVGVVWIAFCVIVVNSMNLFARPVLDSLLPRAEIDFILDEKLSFPLWHEVNIGSYLVYRFSDSEGNSTKLARADSRIITQHRDVVLAESDGLWRDEFLKVQPKTVLARTYSPIYESLRENPRWRLVFQRGEKIDSHGESIPELSSSASELPLEGGHRSADSSRELGRHTGNSAQAIPRYAWAVFIQENEGL